MKIAVDARPLAGPSDGIRRYTRSLLAEMIPGPHQWFLYSDAPFISALADHPNVRIRHGRAQPSSAFGLCYSQGLYRAWCRRDGVDLFWSPRHHLPLGLGRKLPQVVTIHDLVWKRFPQTMRRRVRLLERLLMPASLRQASSIVCVSRFTASEITYFWPGLAEKCVIIHSAATNLGAGEMQPAAGDRPYMLFVGTLEPRKNLPRLLRAYSRLVRDGRIDEDLVIAGPKGWGGADVATLVRDLGIGERVRATGSLPDQNLAQLYRRARCLLMPSLYEGFGLPVLEAMQFGVPVIASNAGSLPEVAGGGALLVDPESEKDIATAIESLMADHDLHARLSAEALQRATDFSWQNAARELARLFDRLTTRDRRRQP